jgi:hypothetical protein
VRDGVRYRAVNYLKNGIVAKQHIRSGEQRRQNVKTFAKAPWTLVFFSAQGM